MNNKMISSLFKANSRPTKALVKEKIRVRGTVQGVGFRPTVYRKEFSLRKAILVKVLLLDRMVAKEINSLLASFGGRLFDDVAATIGICRELCSYESQGAIAL